MESFKTKFAEMKFNEESKKDIYELVKLFRDSL